MGGAHLRYSKRIIRGRTSIIHVEVVGHILILGPLSLLEVVTGSQGDAYASSSPFCRST